MLGTANARATEPLFRTAVRPYRLGPLLLAIARARLTGHLLLSSDMVERTIHFHRGMPVFSHSTQFGERLGPIAVRMELVTREQLARALSTARSRELELGRALVSLEMVSGSQLFALLGEQLVQQVGAANAAGARARFFADRRDGLPLLRLHPMTGVMAAVRAVTDPERKQLMVSLGPRKLTACELPEAVRDWLGDVGFQGGHEELGKGGPTFTTLCSRIAVRMHPGTRHRFSRQPVADPKPKKRPGNDTAPLGTHVRRKISSMEMLAVQSPPLDADASELIALSLLFAGCVRLEIPEPPPPPRDPPPRALTADDVLSVIDQPVEESTPEVEAAEDDGDDPLEAMVEAYLFERRPPDVAARMAVWGPGLEATDDAADLLGQYLSVIHDSDPYRVLGVDSRATGGTLEEMRDAQLGKLEVPEDAPILLRAKAAELRQCVELAYGRLALMAPQRPTPDPGAADDGVSDAEQREAARREAELVDRAQRMLFAGDYRQLKSLLGPDAEADRRSPPLRLAYALACSELARGDERRAAVERAQEALAELMASGGQRTSALGLWSVGHRTEKRPKRRGLVLALLIGLGLGYAAATVLRTLGY